jgi:soluble lytic murein transglycosylase
MPVPMLVFALAAAVGCQQDARRDSRGEVAVVVPTAPAPISTPDADVRAAQEELADGRAWPATRLVYRAIKEPERRTPEALLVAARSAAAWKGWTLVNALLAYEPWLDTRFAGEGRELLARSALERGDAAVARDHAEAALRARANPASMAVRTVLLARALDRLDVRDSSASTYRRAAEMLPAAREWLLLRAAGVTTDPKQRERLYSQIEDSAARARIAYSEALALERFGMHLAAANEYEKLGDVPSALRLRLASDYDPALRTGLESALLGYIQRDATGENLSRAIQVLDAAFPKLDAASELLVARRAAQGGLAARAAQGFAKVPAAQVTDADAIAWARALIGSSKSREAATMLGRRRFGAGAAAEALYVRALAQVRSGSTTAARATLQRVISTQASTRFAGDALYLLADLESDAGRDARARDLHQRACTHARPGGFADEACFRAGVLSFALNDPRRAATAFDQLTARHPQSPEVPAAIYWAGRSYERAGNAAAARERFLRVLEGDPLSYYASRAAARLDTAQWLPKGGEPPQATPFKDVLDRAALLEYLGMDVEERYEYEALEREAARQPANALAVGAVLLDRGEVTRSIRLGWRAVGAARTARDSAGRMDERGYHLVYPVYHEVELIARARQNNLDPALVAAVIRQESSWNPRALSRAGARGLMQIMPRVGEAIARSKGYPVWDPALLFDPDVSLELGTAHLRAALAQYSSLPRALAAYNAGGSRVNRWSRRAGVADPELFVERIPFVETRDYVRIVMRNAEIYRVLHDLNR